MAVTQVAEGRVARPKLGRKRSSESGETNFAPRRLASWPKFTPSRSNRTYESAFRRARKKRACKRQYGKGGRQFGRTRLKGSSLLLAEIQSRAKKRSAKRRRCFRR